MSATTHSSKDRQRTIDQLSDMKKHIRHFSISSKQLSVHTIIILTGQNFKSCIERGCFSAGVVDFSESQEKLQQVWILYSPVKGVSD